MTQGCSITCQMTAFLRNDGVRVPNTTQCELCQRNICCSWHTRTKNVKKNDNHKTLL